MTFSMVPHEGILVQT